MCLIKINGGGGGQFRVKKTYSIRDKARSLDTSRLGSLEEVNHTLCLESLQLGVDADEGPCSPHSITKCSCCVCRGERVCISTSVCTDTKCN